MDSRAALKGAIDSAEFVVMTYLSDLSDADLMHRPHAGCNHINWQVGHLIASEHQMMNGSVPGGMPALPDGFAEKYYRATAENNDPSAFCTKDELMATYNAQRIATLAALEKVTDEGLDAPTEIHYAPTVGSVFTMQCCHWLMHCGQWVIVRRNLNKPVVI
jgi:hypothetical protein